MPATPQQENIEDNIDEYEAEMTRLEYVPIADDYNNVLDMLRGAPFRHPSTVSR